MACEPRLGLRVLAADVAREPGLVYDAVDVTRPPPARFSWRALYAATAAAAAAADERSGAGRALEPGDFSFEREIGVGAFGQVVLATHKKTGTRYAVKTISKKVLRRKKIAQRIWRLERDVLVRIEPHPYIVPLLGSFQTLSHFFLVMAYLPGGELFETLRERGAFSEEISSFYAAEVTLALEHLHASGVIHRDLKPENLLLDARAHCVVPRDPLFPILWGSNVPSVRIDPRNASSSLLARVAPDCLGAEVVQCFHIVAPKLRFASPAVFEFPTIVGRCSVPRVLDCL